MEEERPSRIEDLVRRAMLLGVFRMCMPIDIFETGQWLAEHEQFEEVLHLAPDFAESDNHFARFCFAYALEKYAKANGATPAVVEAAQSFADDADPYARKHARTALALANSN
jgi:hypothetical protein